MQVAQTLFPRRCRRWNSWFLDEEADSRPLIQTESQVIDVTAWKCITGSVPLMKTDIVRAISAGVAGFPTLIVRPEPKRDGATLLCMYQLEC
jgi:hypothetical protein